MRLLLTITLFTIFGLNLFSQSKVEYRQTLLLMGCTFEFVVVDQDTNLCKAALDTAIAEVRRIENLVSSWKETSETSRINRHAGKGIIKIDKELYHLISRAKKVSDLTADAFSICFGSVYHLYDFNGQTLKLPTQDSLDYYKKLTGSDNLSLKENSQVQLESDSEIGFGAIAKGYAADKVKEKLLAMGIKHACINASGDLTVWGLNKDGESWKIGISDPLNSNDILLQLKLDNSSIVTSGDYEKYFLGSDGAHYSHIIDPRTCLPVKTRLSVSVISASTEFSDALATAISVIGVKKGLALVNKLKGVEAVIIDQNHEVYYSNTIDHN